MARRVFLHLGTPKTGTSYLQSLWWANKQALADQGLLLPGGRHRHHFFAAAVMRQMQRVVDDLPRHDHWERMVGQVAEWSDDALISNEHFAPVPADPAAAALSDLHAVAEEVHLVVTVRDLARQVLASWQQRVKQGFTGTLEDFCDRIADRPGELFWEFHDVPAVLRRWGAQTMPAARVHVVVLGRPGSPRETLVQQMCALLGIDAGRLSAAEPRANESLDAVQVELLRRLNDTVPGRVPLARSRLQKGWFTREVLVREGGGTPLVLPRPAQRWSAERGVDMVAQLRAAGYDVRGDLDDLLPAAQPDDALEEVAEADVAALAVRALGLMLDHEAEQRG